MAIVFLCGCSTTINSEKKQQELDQLYYSNKLADAAKLAGEMSDALRDLDNNEALLWHLEAGNVYLDAGDFKKSMAALNRAEKLLYLLDGSGRPMFHRPGLKFYRGSRSDRLLLHLIKGFNYLSVGKIEDFLVEIRRLRSEQFTYILNYADPEILKYEQANSGKPNITPLAMKRLFKDSELLTIYQESKIEDAFLEYSQRRRPLLPLFYNPLAFYLSVIGYTFDREYEEAKIDLEYLMKLDPENLLYLNDAKAITIALGDNINLSPEERKAVIPAPDDQVICVIVGRGKPEAWKTKGVSFQLKDQVPTDWDFSYPLYHSFSDPGFSVKTPDGTIFNGIPLADLSQIQNEEYWQWMFPLMAENACKETKKMTVAHNAALASLDAANSLDESFFKDIAVTSAEIMVESTERAEVDDSEWRRWITLPRCYSFAHFPLTTSLTDRKFTISLTLSDGSIKEETLTLGADTNRAVVYIRVLDDDKYILKCWESME